MMHGNRTVVVGAGLVLLAALVRSDVIFSQDFSYGGTVGDYETGGSATGSLFTDIGHSADGDVAVTNEALALDLPMGPNTESYDAGWGVTALGDGGVMLLKMMVTYEAQGPNDWGPFGHVTFGDYNGNYNTYPHNASKFARIGLRRSGTNMQYEPEGAANFTVPYGTTHILRVYLNDSGVAETYLGPDGEVYDLSVWNRTDGGGNPYVAGSYAVWVDDVIQSDNIEANNYIHSGTYNTRVLDTVMMCGDADTDKASIVVTLDDFEIRDDLPAAAAAAGTVVIVE